jgi:hypothetical protein
MVEVWAAQRHGVESTTEEADQVWQDAMRPSGPPVSMHALGHIEQIVRFLPQVFPYFAGRPWVLIEFERKSLLTCDTPLTLVQGCEVDGTAGRVRVRPGSGQGRRSGQLAGAQGLKLVRCPGRRRVSAALAGREILALGKVHRGHLVASCLDRLRRCRLGGELGVPGSRQRQALVLRRQRRLPRWPRRGRCGEARAACGR